jgi:hypothetical protein
MFTTSLERLEQIETERSTTASDPQFREWMKTLNVSRSYKDQEPKIRGAELTRQYDYSNKNNIHFLN